MKDGPKEYYFSCPSCGQNKDFHKPYEEKSSTGCLLFVFGGIIPAFIYASSKEGKILCTECSFIFRQPGMPTSRTSEIMNGWSLILAVLFMVILFVQSTNDLPDFVSIILGVLVFALVACLAVSSASNRKFHKVFAEQYKTHAQSFEPKTIK